MGQAVTYLFDPLCGWCYGAAPALDRLRRAGVALRTAPTGLFSGEGARRMDAAFASFAWTSDQRIARMTGQVFSERYRDTVLADRGCLFDSGPATLALSAVASVEPDREFEALKALQAARYVEGLDITATPVLRAVLETQGLGWAAEAAAKAGPALLERHRLRIAQARGTMSRLGASGVPTVVVGQGAQATLLPSGVLFGPPEQLTQHMAAAGAGG
jgi:putative protein-disulfide isomerase